MAYNLDFSGWKDMRKAQADSILNQANIAANLIAHRSGNVKKLISGLAGVGTKAYGDYKAAKEEEKMFDLASKTGLLPEGMDDPMQILSEHNALTGDEEVDKENADLLRKWIMQKRYL